MVRANRIIKHGFSYGVVDGVFAENLPPEDYRNANEILLNATIKPNGGIQRRAGFKHVALLDEKATIIPLDAENRIIMLMARNKYYIFQDDILLADSDRNYTAPIRLSEEDLRQINWVRHGDSTVICCGALPPLWVKPIYNVGGDQFYVRPDQTFLTRRLKEKKNFQTFLDLGTTLTATRNTRDIIPTIRLNSPAAYFYHLRGIDFAAWEVYIKLTEQDNPANHAFARILKYVNSRRILLYASLNDFFPEEGTVYNKMQEESFSIIRGWPKYCAFHKGRMVLGNSRSAPNDLWISQAGHYDNYNALITPTADGPIHLRIGTPEETLVGGGKPPDHKAIRGLASRDSLYVFTERTIWSVEGEEFDPATIKAQKIYDLPALSKTGAPIKMGPNIALLPDLSGHKIWMTTFEKSGALLPKLNLATNLPEGLLVEPNFIDIDSVSNSFHFANTDGSMAQMTFFEESFKSAWSKVTTSGHIHSMGSTGKDFYITVQRGKNWFLERLDPEKALLDSALFLEVTTPSSRFQDERLTFFENQEVCVVTEEGGVEYVTVRNKRFFLKTATKSLQLGLPFQTEIKPLPTRFFDNLSESSGPLPPRAIRPLRYRLIFDKTSHCAIDIGNGLKTVLFHSFSSPRGGPLSSFTGEVTLSGIGWIKNSATPLWRICQQEPGSLALRAVWTEVLTTK